MRQRNVCILCLGLLTMSCTNWMKGENAYMTSGCEGAYEIRDANGACVCNSDSLRFADRCIERKECTGKRVNNGDGTCTCFGTYAYIDGDCFTVGDTVEFGRYPQNENSPVPLPLTWQILKINDDSVLLISQYVLEQYTYHDQQEDITWEHSNIRSYLNGLDGSHNKNGVNYEGRGFIDLAFTASERKQIKTVTNTNPGVSPEGRNSMPDDPETKDRIFLTPGGNDTEDRIFLLSRDEVLDYFPTNKSRIASPTAYAIQPPASSKRKNLYTCQITCSHDNSCDCKDGTWNNHVTNIQPCSDAPCAATLWWLRSPGNNPDHAAVVDTVGNNAFTFVDDDELGLRPALYRVVGSW